MLCFYKYYLLHYVYICMTEVRLYIWRTNCLVLPFFPAESPDAHTCSWFLHTVTPICVFYGTLIIHFHFGSGQKELFYSEEQISICFFDKRFKDIF